MAKMLTLQEVRSYVLPDGTKVDLEKLAMTVPGGDWRKAEAITELKVGQVVRVDALGGWRLGVVEKLGRTKVTVALTTQGAILDVHNRAGKVRVQASSYHVSDVRVPKVEPTVETKPDVEGRAVCVEAAHDHGTLESAGDCGSPVEVQEVGTLDDGSPVVTAPVGTPQEYLARLVEEKRQEAKAPGAGLEGWKIRQLQDAMDATGSWPVTHPARGVAQVAPVDEVDALETQTELEGPEERYGLEVLSNGQVAITDAWRGSWAGILTGAHALEVATRSIQRMNREMIGLGGGRTPGRHDFKGQTIASLRVCSAQVGVQGGGSTPCLLPPEDPTHRPAPMVKVRPGDVVTIHRGVSGRWEVERLELDAFASGERLDYARVAPIDRRELAPQWVNVDMLHVVETSAGDTGAILFAQRRLEQEVKVLTRFP